MSLCGVPLARVHLPRDFEGFRRLQERWLLAKPRVPARPDNRGHGKNWTVGRRLRNMLAKDVCILLAHVCVEADLVIACLLSCCSGLGQGSS